MESEHEPAREIARLQGIIARARDALSGRAVEEIAARAASLGARLQEYGGFYGDNEWSALGVGGAIGRAVAILEEAGGPAEVAE